MIAWGGLRQRRGLRAIAFSALTGDRGLFARNINSIGRDLLAGAVCDVLSLAFGLSSVALIFSGPLAPRLAYGIAVSFIASSVAALVVALDADFLVKQCVRIEVTPGDIVARQGDPADALHFILDGRISILVGSPDHQIRIRSLRSHTTVGEMGLITSQPRNATIRAETQGILYALSLSAYERIKAEHPAAALALLGYIITVMSERLSFANRVVGVLQR